ncbi:MAG: metalloregulator ArsR/SmtB family transcription factor [Clostridiaceae bacterium]
MEEFQVNIYKALAHPIRLKILKRLQDGETCVCRLTEELEFSQANLSQHLKILKDAKLVNSKKCGMFMYYSLASEKIRDLIRLTEEIYNKD